MALTIAPKVFIFPAGTPSAESKRMKAEMPTAD